MAFTGGGGATNTGNIFIALKPLTNAKSPRRRSSTVAPAAQPPPGRLHFLSFPGSRIGGRGSSALYSTPAIRQCFRLTVWGPRMLAEMKRCRPAGRQHDQQNGGLDIRLDYNRVTAARLGQTRQSLDQENLCFVWPSQTSIIYTH